MESYQRRLQYENVARHSSSSLSFNVRNCKRFCVYAEDTWMRLLKRNTWPREWMRTSKPVHIEVKRNNSHKSFVCFVHSDCAKIEMNRARERIKCNQLHKLSKCVRVWHLLNLESLKQNSNISRRIEEMVDDTTSSLYSLCESQRVVLSVVRVRHTDL